MLERQRWVRLLAPLVLLLGLACGPCNLLSSDVPTPPRPIAVSTESATQLESRIRQNLSGEPGQQFILRMTDAEVTSLVATQLAKYDESPVADPQIWFTKGKVYTSGRLVNVLPVETDIFMISSARIADGRVTVEIEEASAGALPVPAGVLDTISQSVNETVAELQLEVQVTALEILEGEAIVKGVRK
ncbi:MAG: hypothetical protein M8467_16555 [Anaerolineae bacterium]|nr:hypothetical protein [Anaerolineae bacterium]